MHLDHELRVSFNTRAVTCDNATWREVGDGAPDTDARKWVGIAEMAFTE